MCSAALLGSCRSRPDFRGPRSGRPRGGYTLGWSATRDGGEARRAIRSAFCARWKMLEKRRGQPLAFFQAPWPSFLDQSTARLSSPRRALSHRRASTRNVARRSEVEAMGARGLGPVPGHARRGVRVSSIFAPVAGAGGRPAGQARHARVRTAAVRSRHQLPRFAGSRPGNGGGHRRGGGIRPRMSACLRRLDPR